VPLNIIIQKYDGFALKTIVEMTKPALEIPFFQDNVCFNYDEDPSLVANASSGTVEKLASVVKKTVTEEEVTMSVGGEGGIAG
jgi:hypothetical protein